MQMQLSLTVSIVSDIVFVLRHMLECNVTAVSGTITDGALRAVVVIGKVPILEMATNEMPLSVDARKFAVD